MKKIQAALQKPRKVKPTPVNRAFEEYYQKEFIRKEILFDLMKNEVNIPCIDGVLIEPSVKIGKSALIFPNTIITGNSVIGEKCVIGPNTRVIDSSVGGGTKLDNVLCENSEIGENCDIGPFVHIRPNSNIKNNVHLGNFVEVKNSNIDNGTKVSHLTYVGDSDVGKNVNFGCGCVTVNYDGVHKYRCTIGDNAFIGCNTNLIAPVKVGDNTFIAAGSTITDGIEDGDFAIARARQVNKKGLGAVKLKDRKLKY